jgi:hypothetical protein
MPNIIAVVAVFEIQAEMHEKPSGARADPRQRQHRVGHPAVEAVEEDAAGENEGADEEEHQRIGERREHIACRGDLERHAGGGPEQGGDRQWKRLRHPQHHHRAHHGGEAVRLGREPA